MADTAPGKKFIGSAIKRPGAFSAKAARAGKSTQAFAEEKKGAPGTLGKEARFDLVLNKVRQKKRKNTILGSAR